MGLRAIPGSAEEAEAEYDRVTALLGLGSEREEFLVIPRVVSSNEAFELRKYVQGTGTPTWYGGQLAAPFPTRPNLARRNLSLAKVLEAVDFASDQLKLPVDHIDAAITRNVRGAEHGWHTDRLLVDGPSWDRTLSLSIILSEPEEHFTGGQLQFAKSASAEEQRVTMPALHLGDVVAFSSGKPHCLTTITRGVRVSGVLLCGWTREPEFSPLHRHQPHCARIML